jgi:hypothetical protein
MGDKHVVADKSGSVIEDILGSMVDDSIVVYKLVGTVDKYRHSPKYMVVGMVVAEHNEADVLRVQQDWFELDFALLVE